MKLMVHAKDLRDEGVKTGNRETKGCDLRVTLTSQITSGCCASGNNIFFKFCDFFKFVYNRSINFDGIIFESRDKGNAIIICV